MKDLMVDIETLGTRSGSAILWLAAAFFDRNTGLVGATFSQAIDIKSNLEAGLNANAQTALWWMGQETALEAWVKEDKVTIEHALIMFDKFVADNTKDMAFHIWGNSNRFDMGLMENAYQAFSRKISWKFRNERDVRTLVDFNPRIKEACIKEAKEAGHVLHHPLIDSFLQIKYVSKIFNSIIVTDNTDLNEDGTLND